MYRQESHNDFHVWQTDDMTKVIVNPGICLLVSTIEVQKTDKRKLKVLVTSECKMATKLGESLAEVGQWDVIKRHVDSKVYQAASECRLHPACPIPVAIIKAVEVETGLALPRDVVIHFAKPE